MTLEEYIAQLQRADAQINIKNAALLHSAIEDLKDYGQTIGHERTGFMVESMHTIGPFSLGQGIQEAFFESEAPYAETEVERGGTHDWATRTINEQQARITQLATEVEGATVTALVGGA